MLFWEQKYRGLIFEEEVISMAKRPLELLTESMFYVLMALTEGKKCGTEVSAYIE